MKKSSKKSADLSSRVCSDNLVDLIENQVLKTPDKAAIYFDDICINFKQLNELSNQIAHYIKKTVPGYGQNIVICLNRDPLIIVCILAILKSNNIYIPIDIEAPSRSIAEIVKDSTPSLILVSSQIYQKISKINSNNIKIITVDDCQDTFSQLPNTNLEKRDYCELAYILYTSGTTGKPKGVRITQRALINLMYAMRKEVHFTRNDVILAITPFSFDLSVPDIYLPLTTGGSIAIASTNIRFNPIKIIYYISQFNITTMQATPTTWQMLIESGWRNETNIKIITGGEGFPVPLAKKLRAIACNVWNFYGPTETTVWSTSYKVDHIDESRSVVSIGKPISNTQVYILNENRQQQGFGEPGELYIAGDGVSVGYLNRPDLNKKSFIANPFSEDPSSKLYKTGDLVVEEVDGNLHYLGRCDTQIKIRGHRIEAGAIENLLLGFSGVKECVVLDKNPDHQHELVAYLILSDMDVSLKDLQTHLKSHFPSYMVPTRYVVVEQFPITANGKIDRKNIPNISKYFYLKHKKNSAPLQNKYEEILMDLIQAYLQREDIDPESNFFDIGLHSMLLVNITQALNRILSQAISVVDLFQHPTIRSFASYLIKTHHIESIKKPVSFEMEQNDLLSLESDKSHDNYIAVIGMACKVPGADDYRAFWDLILSQKETIEFFDENELRHAGFYSGNYQYGEYVPARGILNDIDKFDAAFFGYTPSEARIMDPQHRVFLEQSWSALEDAGYVANTFEGKIGVYAGMNDSTYLIKHLIQNEDITSNYDPQQLLLATSTHYLSTKIAYAMGLTGPCVTVNTACSTGLVSIAMACNSLINHDCDMAVAGAVTIVTPQHSGYFYQESGILSPDGHCRVFDENAKGTVLSNGCGVVILRRLSDALKDNDHIWGVIKGWAVNNDGASKVSFTAPSVEGQIECVRSALAQATITPTEIEYLEAHGTGTKMGDPIEVSSLTKAYDYETYKKSQYCALGSVKANIGHTDSASGAIGFIKTILALYYKTLPPQINFKKSNPNIDFEHSPYYVNCDARPWTTMHKIRTAAVHSLGFGGTNAHVIVQEAPKTKTTDSKGVNVLIFSAKTEQSLIAMSEAIHEHILNMMQGACTHTHLADLAYTLQIGRKAFKWRTAIPYQSYEHLINVLNSPKLLKMHTTHQAEKKKKRVIFGFVGDGTVYPGMAADIYKEHPYFKQVVDECCLQLETELGIDLRKLLFPKTQEKMQLAKTEICKTQYNQAAVFVIEYALAQLLIVLGIQPAALIGHGIGEYVAATLSGALTRDEALKLVAKPGKTISITDPVVILADFLDLNGQDVFIEIGAGQTLTQTIKQHNLSSKPLLLQTVPSTNDANQNSYEYFLSMIGALWLNHLEVKWERLYINEIRKRCPLPTYVFAKQSHWVPPCASKEMPSNLNNNSDNNVFYKPTWGRERRLGSVAVVDNVTSRKCWIVFCNHIDKVKLLTRDIPDQDLIYVVLAGQEYNELDSHTFVINPQSKDDYVRFLKRVNMPYEECRIIHTWYVHDKPGTNRAKLLFEGPYSILYLVQAFNEEHPDNYLKILIITNQIYSVLGNENVDPIKTAILGPCKVIPQEHLKVSCKLIDLDFGCNWSPILIKNWYRELHNFSSSEFKEEVAYRGEYRWIRKLETCYQEIQTNQQNRLRNHGVYIITGGLGGIGLSIAEHLAVNYHANIILITRSQFLLEEEWQACADDTNGLQDKNFEKAKKLLNIKKHAMSLSIETAAVEDIKQLQSVLHSIKKEHKCIHGVIHAAGVAGGGLAQLKNVETYERVLQPKLDGTANLMRCMQDEPIDFIAMMSSITAITGFPGQIDYCSANCVLDAYANLSGFFNHPVFCVSINWLAWRDVGMAAESDTLLMNLDESNSISYQEGCTIFDKVINSDLNQVVITKIDLNEYKIPQTSLQDFTFESKHNLDILSNLTIIWQQILGIETINIDDDFYELGGHSLLAVGLLSKICHQFKVKIPSTTLFNVKTIRGLAAVIESYKQENESYSPLVMLRQGNASKPPLFMVHPVGGTVFCYMQLAKLLLTDRSIYAFQDPSIEMESSQFSSIEEMAICYLNHIQRIQPTGPYYLCGASFGALVVTEMAYRLENEQKPVNFIGLIDGWGIQSQLDFDVDYIRQIIHLHHQSHIEQIDFDKQPIWENLLLHRLHMMVRYQYKRVQSQLVLFKARDLLDEYRNIDATDNHWTEHSNLPIMTSIISGDHNTILQEPNVGLLVEEIDKYLR